jgi:NDP-sugar pyrophosphorylase family protein
MNAVVLAGGNQMRLASFLDGQSKILFPLSGGRTVLSNIFDQLDAAGVKKIIVRPADKGNIAAYVTGIASNYRAEIIIDSTAWPSPVSYLTDSVDHLPVTFVLGDTYFPEGELQSYILKATEGEETYDGFVGVSKEHVGDARVILEGDHVVDMSHGFDAGNYTCGVFTIYDPKVFTQLEHLDKFAHTWAQLPRLGYKLGYHMVGPGLLDLDTPEEFEKLPKS